MAKTPQPTISKAQLSAWVAFLTAQKRVIERLSAELKAEHDITLNEYEVLLHLDRAPGRRLKMKDLAANVLLTPSGLTRVADRMVADGLLARETCPTDRRSFELTLTPAGRAKFKQVAPTHVRGVHEHFARHLDDACATTLAASLDRIASGSALPPSRRASRGARA